ncbi:MAG: peptidase [Kiritimatiellia bacterium]
MNSPIRTLMVFVDGLGMGNPDPEENPVFSGVCPVLKGMMEEEAVPIDAVLGVEGLPQSATGQTSLLTGINAQKSVGRHIEGFPNEELREIIRRENVFSKLKARGLSSTFANAYYLQGYSEVERRRRRSVTTVATEAAFGKFRNAEDMLAGKAVFQDLTREMLRKRGYEGPLIEPEEAGRHLIEIAKEHEFTLFEYFQTDIAAHRGDMDIMKSVLSKLDRFLSVAIDFLKEPGALFLLTSDHGNLEDFSTRQHTTNPVPFVAMGEGAATLKARVKSLTDVVPALLELCAGHNKS